MSYPHFSADCEDHHDLVVDYRGKKPYIVCLSGSMRFEDQIRDVAIDESLAGHVVVLPLVNMKRDDARWSTSEMAQSYKAALDNLHFRKIDLADEVIVVCPGGYIGESTQNEIDYAERAGKPVRYNRCHPREPIAATSEAGA